MIFVTDVVSFSKLMEKNEDQTLQSFRSCREILDNLFKEHGGRIFNTAGDSVLAEFQSAVSAVSSLQEITENLIEIHGQHGHTSLEKTAEQRKALDKYAKIDLTNLNALRKAREELKGALLETLGHENFEKELELLQFQENEIAQTQIESPEEEERLKNDREYR